MCLDVEWRPLLLVQAVGLRRVVMPLVMAPGAMFAHVAIVRSGLIAFRPKRVVARLRRRFRGSGRLHRRSKDSGRSEKCGRSEASGRNEDGVRSDQQQKAQNFFHEGGSPRLLLGWIIQSQFHAWVAP